MANLTLVIDDDVLRRARIRALESGTSVNALVREFLAALVADDGPAAARARLAAMAKRSKASSGPGGRNWTRDDLHQR